MIQALFAAGAVAVMMLPMHHQQPTPPPPPIVQPVRNPQVLEPAPVATQAPFQGYSPQEVVDVSWWNGFMCGALALMLGIFVLFLFAIS